MLSDIWFTHAKLKKAAEMAGKVQAEPWVPPSAFIRSTRKYWVRGEVCPRYISVFSRLCSHMKCVGPYQAEVGYCPKSSAFAIWQEARLHCGD